MLFRTDNDIVQACIDAKSQSADGDVCITDLDVLIELEIIPLEIASLFAGTLILCDSNLCNSQARLQDTCSPSEYDFSVFVFTSKLYKKTIVISRTLGGGLEGGGREGT